MGRYSDACNYAVPLALTDRILAVISAQEFQKKSDEMRFISELLHKEFDQIKPYFISNFQFLIEDEVEYVNCNKIYLIIDPSMSVEKVRVWCQRLYFSGCKNTWEIKYQIFRKYNDPEPGGPVIVYERMIDISDDQE